MVMMLQKRIRRGYRDILNHLSPLSFEEVDNLNDLLGNAPIFQATARYFGASAEFLRFHHQCAFSVYNQHSSLAPFDSSESSGRYTVRGVSEAEDVETRELVSLLTQPRGISKAVRIDWRSKASSVMFIHQNCWLDFQGPVPGYLGHRFNTATRFYLFGLGAGGGEGSQKLQEIFPVGMLFNIVSLYL